LSTTIRAHSAPGDVDLSFNANLGISSPVHAVAVQSDGKVLAGGPLTFVNSTNRYGSARLNPDGSPDTTFVPASFHPIVGELDFAFHPSLGDFTTVTAFAPQPDGKVLVAGIAFHYDCDDEGCVVYDGYFVTRHHPDGSRDASFAAAVGNRIYGGGEVVHSLAVEANGKILVGGWFHAVNGTNRNGIARLNANGTLDTSSPLNISSNYLFTARALAVQPDGKFFIDGVRYHHDGTLDSSFAGVGGVLSVSLQPDGKVLIGGNFTTVHGTDRNRIARLNADGSLDTNFNPGSGADATVRSIALQGDGDVVIGGDFQVVNGTNRNRVARLNADGSLDGGFDPEPGIERAPTMIALQPDGKVLIGEPMSADDPWWGPAGGTLAFVNGTNRHGRMRLGLNGRVDREFITTPFQPPLTAFFHTEDCLGDPRFGCLFGVNTTALLVQPDGAVLLSGYSVSTITGDEVFYQVVHPFLARFNASGGLEARFDHLTNAYEINALARQSDGKILLGGWFDNAGFSYVVTRLNTDGSVDNTFNSRGTGANGVVHALALQPDGKMLIGGTFTSLNGTNRAGIARLHPNGGLDVSFNPGSGADGNVFSIALQPDGKALIGGSFYTINGTNRSRIARLKADGSLDSSFNPAPDGTVRAIALQSNGEILIAGDFNSVNGVPRKYLARLYGDFTGLAPTLSFVRAGGFLTLNWPVTPLNFQLQECTNLTLADAWSPVTQLAMTNGAQISVTVPTSAARKFFRLESQ